MDANIGWVESIAQELDILWIFQAGHVNCNIIIHGDNTGVIGAFSKGSSCNIHRNESICCMASSIIPNNISISPIYVPSTLNKADPISSGTLGHPSL